ncbi:G5 domain-containing protein [Streptococcus pneumoniae]
MKDIFNKRQRFSIRKFSVGVASVLIGFSLFAPTQGVLASTENNNDNNTGIEVNSETDNSLPTVEIKEEAQSISEHRNNASSEIDAKEISTVATKETVLDTSGGKENINSTATTLVAGEDRSSAPEVRAASNPTEIKKYELTEEDAKKIKAGIIGSEGDKYDSLLLDGPELKPNDYTDEDYLSNKDEIYIYEKNGKKYVGYNSHPLLEDTDGDGIIDSDEKSDEKLKWNVSERDMIMFMELSYRDDKYIDRVLDHKKPLTESELYKKKGESKPRYEYMMMNRELGPYWERKKSYHTSSGLDAVLFETKSDFLYLPNGTAQVLAFRGTSDGKDIVADGILGTGSDPKQAKEAEAIMRELAKDKSITNLYLTGHSLGGYLVQRAMVEAYQLAYSNNRGISPAEKLDYKNFYENILKKGTTFNAPKVRTGLLSSSAFWQKGLDSKKIAKSGKMTHYIVNNDSTIGKSVSNDSDVVINVGDTKGGHSSRSYFEADMINRRPEFISGKRISLDGIGFQNPKIATAKSLEKVGETAVYSKRGDDIIKSTTVSMKDPDTGNITKNTTDEIFKKDGAKDKVETTEIPSPKKYVKDDTREKGQANVEVPGKTGEQTVTTTYSVNPNTGDLIEHVGQPVVKQPATETVVKVAAKDEVEYIKKGDDVVKKTTSYTVDPKIGSLTFAEKEEVVNRGGAKDKVEYNSVEPKPVYLKDENSPKGTVTVQFPGKAGKTKVTTTYSVNPVNGTLIPSKGKPEVVYRPIAIVVKVGAKDKVVETPIEPEVEYVKDVEKNFGTPDERIEGKKGKTVTTTTYDVDSKDGHITEHVGTPVVTPAGKTIVKVGAKTKVEHSKDPEGRDVIDTTTYEVNPKTGKVTPTTVRTYGKTKAPTVEKRVVPSPVVYEKDDSRDKDSEPVRKEGTPGEETITTTYTVDPKTGAITPTVGKPVRTKEPTNTIVKVAAKDKVETTEIPSPKKYVKDDTRDKDQPNVEEAGQAGSRTVTTTYEVNPSDGTITERVGEPVVVNPTATIVKVAAKDKVVETPIEPEVEYVRDGEKDFGTPAQRTEGKKGKTVTTTTYDVDPNDGHITEHVGTPDVTRAGKTIVKVGAKTKVERNKDDQGRDVIDTTTYEVNPKTGKVTPTTVRTYGTSKEPTVEKRVVPSPVVYEKDNTKEKGTAPTTVKGEDGEDTITTTYTVDTNTGKIIVSEGNPVRTKEPTNTIVRVPAKDKVETTEIPSPKKYVKDDTRDKGQDNVEETGQAGSSTVTTTYEVNPSDGTITERVGEPVVVNPTATIVKVAAKDRVVETPIEPEVEYVRDVEKDFGTPAQRTEGKKGKTVTTTTYDVDPKDGHIIEHVGNPVVTPAGKTIVKVGAKTKVERNKDDQGRDVIDTTTYAVDPKTGKVTPTTVRTYGKTKAPMVEKRVVPSPVVYEKDNTKEKGTAPTTVKGEDGEDTITTTYTVDTNTGKIIVSEGNPVRTKEPTNTIVKVAAKDRVVETPIEPEVEYVRDVEKDFGTPAQRTEGKKGKTVTTTTYDVDPKDGHITEHVGNPVVTPAGKTIVKVGAKTKVERNKDDQGRDVIDTTTYEVNPQTGKVTPTTVRTYGTSKEPTVEKRVVPSPVVYEKDDTKEKGTAPTTVKGEDGEDTITTTYTVDTNTGKIIVSEGKPVRTKEPTNTIVKVAAKDKVVETPIEPEVEYVRDGEREVDTPNERVEGAKGKTVTTTTYDVDSNDGHITEHVGNLVVTPAGKTIVKVGAKTKVEQSKDSEGRDVIDTTTYAVDPKTGKVTPTTVRTYGKTKEPTVEKRVVPSPVVYEKDDTKEKGTAPTTVKGEDGEDTITTTYTVDTNTGKIIVSEGKPARTKEPTNTVVKVAAKDKVVETLIEPEVEYVRDGEREVDTPNERVEGAKGKTVTTTTYDVDSKDGHITEHVGTPVVSPAGKTIVKVGAKTKVERNKDDQGRDVIDTTTYEVNPQTGKVTPTTVRTYGTSKEPTVEKRVVPSPVVYEKDNTKEKGTAPTTVKGEDGEDTITTTYTVDTNTGKIIVSEGNPVRTKEPTNTIVRVPAKDKVETTEIPSPKKYVKDDTREKDQDNLEEAGKAGSSTTTTTYSVDPTTGAITERVGNPVVVNPTATIVKVAAKDRVVETPIEPEVEYIKDVERDFGTPDQRTEGEKGKTVTTTTYDVDSNDGHITEHVGNPVVSPAGKTIVKVGAKTKVEQSKDSEGRDVIDTTTYEVDPKTGKVTPTTVRTYGTMKEPKVELEQDPKTGEVTVTPKKPDGSTYPPGTTVEIPGKAGNSIVVTIGEDGKGKVPNSDLPDVEKPGTGKITEPGKPAVEVPVENPVKSTISVNGEIPDPIHLTELTIEVRWYDEDGNVLKSSVKTGDAGVAGHGVIPRYEFLRTEVDDKEPIIIHIFRKVSSDPSTIQVPPVTQDTNGDSSQYTPPLATPIQDAVSPNANHRSTTATIDNESKSNDSQNVLPRLGTESSMTLASLGLLGMLSSLGLAFGKKKED